MKKVLAVAAVIAVVCVAGSALAQPRAREQGRRLPPPPQAVQGQPGQPAPQAGSMPNPRMNPQFSGEPCYCGRGRGNDRGGNFGPQGMPGDFGGRGRKGGFGRMMFAPDMPEDIKAKAVEVAKLRIDLDAALSQKPIDKAKALEVFTQIQKAEQEIEAWKFGKRIEQIEAFRKQQEINRNVPPAPAPKPEEKPETAE
ncbi:MAG: hypothetical protein IJS28_12070 [Synergistaceae bacterium]|nr:hypothetical protein [Synergistaceae bacterium]